MHWQRPFLAYLPCLSNTTMSHHVSVVKQLTEAETMCQGIKPSIEGPIYLNATNFKVGNL